MKIIFLDKRLNLLLFLFCFIFVKINCNQCHTNTVGNIVSTQAEFIDAISNCPDLVSINDNFDITQKINVNILRYQFEKREFDIIGYAPNLPTIRTLETKEKGDFVFKSNINVPFSPTISLGPNLQISGDKGFDIEGLANSKHRLTIKQGTHSTASFAPLKLDYSGFTTLKNRTTLTPVTDDSLSSKSHHDLQGISTILNLNHTNQTIRALTGNGTVEIGGSSLTIDGSSNTNFNFSGYFKASSEGTLIKDGSPTSTFNLLDNRYHKNSSHLKILILKGFFLIDSEKIVSDIPIEIAGGYFGNVKDKIVTMPSNKSFILKEGGFHVENETLTIDGIIAGAGTGSEQLIKTGEGTLVLNHLSNSYSGGTKIDDGSVIFTNLSQLGSGEVILNGGELKNNAQISNFSKSLTLNDVSTNTLNNQDFMIITSNITGAGGFIKKGAGDLILSGTNIFGGTMEVQQGSVDVSNDSNFGAGIVILNGGSLVNFTNGATYTKNITFGSNNGTIFSDTAVTFNGIFSGSGGFIKDGSGQITLANTSNSYSGDTTINHGSLKLDDADVLPSTTNVNISNGSSLDLNDMDQTIGALSGSGDLILGSAALTLSPISTGSIYTGVISGTGSLVKTNTGANTLAGDNVYSGTTTVNGGKLIINGSITSDATINASGTLKGTGTITGSTIVNGTVSPGNSIGTLNFVGNYTQTSGSTLEIEIDHISSDLVNVTSGSISIDSGATLSIISDVDSHSIKTEYIIMQSDNSVTGIFSNLTFSKPHLFSRLIYNPTNVVLVMVAADFKEADKDNPKRVSNYLLSNNPTNNFDLIQLYIGLDDLNSDDLNQALNQLHPSKYKGLILSQENNNKLILKTILSNLNEPYKQFCKSYNMFWSNFSYDKYDQNGKNYLIGFDSKTKSFTIGNDFYLKDLIIGPFFSYSNSEIKWKKDQGDAKLNSIYFGVYNKYKNRSYYLNSVLLSSMNFVKSDRNIKYGFINKRAFTKHNIYDVAIDIENGFNITKNKLILRPFFNTIYQVLLEDRFKEKKAPGANLRVKSSINNFLRFEIGSNLNTYFVTAKNTYIYPDIGVFYVYEKRFGGSSYLSQIDETFPYFTTYGIKPNPSRLAYNLGLSNKLFNSKLNMTLKYQAEYGKKYKDQNVNLVIKYNF